AESAEEIRRAIAAGVPMFNHGNAAATVAVYRAVSEQLMRNGDLSAVERMRLQHGLEQAADAHSMRTSAWQLRYALDDVNDSLHNGQMSAMAR
ncbi:MAG: hypothetical protein AAGD86_11310, partial [Pseudomonadota bacterium]